MKKTLTVNLAGTVFHIDDDAYPVLERYIDALKSYYGLASLAEKEAGLAVFFQSHLGTRSVVSYHDVEEACNALGCPPGFNPRNPFAYQRQNDSGFLGRQKLYRNESNKKLAGVCSGLGEYFDVDPLIIRLAFLVAFFGYGFGGLLYIVLWIATPSKEA